MANWSQKELGEMSLAQIGNVLDLERACARSPMAAHWAKVAADEKAENARRAKARALDNYGYPLMYPGNRA